MDGLSDAPTVIRGLCQDLVRQLDAAHGGAGAPRISAAAVGLRGMMAMDRAGRLDPYSLHDVLARGLGTERTAVSTDAVTAHLGALGGRGGAVLVVGTGAVGVAVDEYARWYLADGLGYLVGDQGSGGWIGREGLTAANKARDGRQDGASQVLLRAAERHFGRQRHGVALDSRPDALSLLAEFAKDVLAAAEAGDPVSVAIRATAARGLADTLCAVLGHPGVEARVATTGNLMAKVPELRALVMSHVTEVRPDVEMVPTVGEPLDGALVLARRLLETPEGVPSNRPFLSVRMGTQDPGVIALDELLDGDAAPVRAGASPAGPGPAAAG
ncbi:BadF/BadG/BcrA/BcrD ATPase family protein [Promicromonospora sp. AC04]|uniref:BadF/BadG/BcrA/BcrD ATPase family protein n=1 Tax=Promicromonospora sp. AC04 TaxID=2135723 RepID=UPI000D431234|nr:BadF/BadG/BcrA/BcrD ATPase family protein [Promicromonospora sp. AC04]PUB26999.1 BadF/BadG/BcrA/BcrD ATPase family protein [Promicromonospora sp. AC04]